MTTSKPYHGRDAPVAFNKPTVGARVYVVESLSNWPETFDRKKADAALAKFLHPIEVGEALETFRMAMALECRPENWEDVTDFLAKITNQPRGLIPAMVATSFWGQFTVLGDTTNQGLN